MKVLVVKKVFELYFEPADIFALTVTVNAWQCV
jgi:hypothetical protein